MRHFDQSPMAEHIETLIFQLEGALVAQERLLKEAINLTDMTAIKEACAVMRVYRQIITRLKRILSLEGFNG